MSPFSLTACRISYRFSFQFCASWNPTMNSHLQLCFNTLPWASLWPFQLLAPLLLLSALLVFDTRQFFSLCQLFLHTQHFHTDNISDPTKLIFASLQILKFLLQRSRHLIVRTIRASMFLMFSPCVPTRLCSVSSWLARGLQPAFVYDLRHLSVRSLFCALDSKPFLYVQSAHCLSTTLANTLAFTPKVGFLLLTTCRFQRSCVAFPATRFLLFSQTQNANSVSKRQHSWTWSELRTIP